MPSTETLEKKFLEAKEQYAAGKLDGNKYQKAKSDFALARVEERKAEEADPNHPRGNGIASVTEEN